MYVRISKSLAFNAMMNKTLHEDIQHFAATFPLFEQLRGMTIGITGATGLLGSCMTRCLLALNREHQLGLRVLAIVRNADKARLMFGEESDALGVMTYDFASLQPFVPSEKIDSILHFAAPTASREFVDRPVETMNTVYYGTNVLLEYARSHALSSFVLASTLEVYGTVTDDSCPLTESMQGYFDPMATRSSYPMAKRAAEALCHNYADEYSVPARVVRLAQTFGAGVSVDDNRVFAQFAKAVIGRSDIVLNTTGELSRCYCYTLDAMSAMLYVMLKGRAGEAYNVAREDSYISVRDMAQRVIEKFYPQGRVVIRQQEGMGYSPTTRLRLSTEKIQKLGWKASYDLDEMFSRLIQSLKESMQ